MASPSSSSSLASFLDVPPEHDFSLHNLPYGVFSTPHTQPRCGVAVGEWVLDLSVLADEGLFPDFPAAAACFHAPALNGFMAQTKQTWAYVRRTLQHLLSAHPEPNPLRDDAALRARALVPMAQVRMHLPAQIGDYTDFYSSREHATNVGVMFRGKENALQPNWLHLPVGYHGRASSVVVSGTPVVRPHGQLQADAADDKKGSVHGPCRLLDFELEVGAFVGGAANPLGRPLTMAEAEDRLFGLVLMNDWSARDVQKWEYVPLGPFTAKNFATSIGPWVVTMEALQPFICPTSAGAQTDPTPLPYLQDPQYASYDINLEVALQSDSVPAPHPITRSNFRHLYWDVRQQLVHHSVTGCNLRPGDLLGSGTISGADDSALGSMLELSWKGTREVGPLPDGSTRKFLKDGDNVVLRGWCQGQGFRVGFGVCEGKVLPAGSDPVAAGIPAMVEEPYGSTTASSPRFSNLKLYGYWRSSATWRVRIALALKGLAYEYTPVPLLENEHTTAAYTAKNPAQQVPTLECRDLATGETVVLTQSLPIIEFLDEAFPETYPLVPRGNGGPDAALKRAHVRRVAEVVNSWIQPLQNVFVLKKISEESKGAYDGKAFGKDAIVRGLAALEAMVQPLAGKYAVGNAITLADAALIPQLYNARRFDVDLGPYPTLLRVEAALSELPAFKQAHADAQPDSAAS